jgi:hypothetical protein
MKMTILPIKDSKNRLPCRVDLLLPLALACFALSPTARATCQEGCLTNENTALGDDALINTTSGYNNTGVGFDALSANTIGHDNAAVGWGALSNNTTGQGNVAMGAYALNDSNAGANTALGYRTLQTSSGGINTAVGSEALSLNTTGYWNVGVGASALYGNLTGIGNSALGQGALSQLTDGSYNIAVGFNAGELNPDLVVTDDQGKPFTVRYEAVNAMLLNEFLKAHEKVKKLGSVVERHQKQIQTLRAGLQKASAELEASKAEPYTVQNSQ